MRKKNFKGRCEKRKLPKCEDACKTYDVIQYAYADLLNASDDIKSFRVNVRKRQIMMRPDIKLPQPFASWSNSL